ncbi:MAG TPA: non-homologous end-joining DNA ligase [Polyangiaceae bacterium]|jgi:bifunctional non-homologous end joining protein LigD
MPSSAEVAGVAITHPDRVVYGEPGITKLELAEFYHQLSARILPHVEGRPLSVVRCPGGLEVGEPTRAVHQSRGGRGDAKCFFQKHGNANTPGTIGRVPIREAGKLAQYLSIDDEKGLITLIQFGAMELHPWGARADKPDAPDRMIFDLDPGPGVDWRAVVKAALAVKTRLERLELESFVKTTGGKGLHVVVPLARRHDWSEVRDVSRAIAEAMAREEPERYVAQMALHLRPGKIFVDYLRNARGATAVAAYSTRARPGATVAMPFSWDEIDRIDPASFNVRTLARRWARARDPWKGFFQSTQRLPRGAMRAAANS